MKNIVAVLTIATITVLSGCTVSSSRALQASLYADVQLSCKTKDNAYTAILDGSTYHERGFIQINNSTRIDASFNNAGFQYAWRWGNKVGAEHGNVRFTYLILVKPTGSGVFYNSITKERSYFTCTKV